MNETIGSRGIPRTGSVSQLAGGIALACLLSVIAAVVIVATPEILRAVLLWVVYIALCGVAINAAPAAAPQVVLKAAMPPAAAYLVTVFALNGMASLMSVPNYGSGGGGGTVSLTLAITTGVITALLTIPGIFAAIYARWRVFDALQALRNVPVEDLEGLQTKVRVATAIIGAILGWLLLAAPRGGS